MLGRTLIILPPDKYLLIGKIPMLERLKAGGRDDED